MENDGVHRPILHKCGILMIYVNPKTTQTFLVTPWMEQVFYAPTTRSVLKPVPEAVRNLTRSTGQIGEVGNLKILRTFRNYIC